MKLATMKQLQRAADNARREGYAVIGFAVNPEDGGIIKLDNQHMDKDQFCAMMGESLSIFANYTQDGEPRIIVN